MVVCLVSRHTHDDTGKRRPQNGTVGPEIAIFTTILGIGSKFHPKIHHSKYHLRLERHRLLLTSWFSGKTDSFVAVIFMGRSEDGTEPGCEISRRVKSTASRYSGPSFLRVLACSARKHRRKNTI